MLSGIAMAGFGLLYTIDHYWQGKGGVLDFFSFNASGINNSIGSLASMIAAVLGIIITVVSIIVQLSADRFPKVTEMFFKDRTNMAVLGFYVIGCISAIFVAFSLGTGEVDGFVPRLSLTVTIFMAMIGFVIMAPYFAHVFEFLQPENIIARIRGQGVKAVESGMHAGDDTVCHDAQSECVSMMEQLTDITINSIDSKDKILATECVEALETFAVQYLDMKKSGNARWFGVGAVIRQNPDFVAMAQESIDDLVNRRTWVEFKILRQYQAIYAEALGGMKDINYVIAINTRYLGEAAIKAGDHETLALCVKFFNTFMRATLNARDVRTAYNILNQYRQLGESILRAGWKEKITEVATYLKYYAHTSFTMKLPFVTETIAYDLCTLCELASELKSEVEQNLLDTFLLVDDPASDGESVETGLRGVRKAQVKLATWYLVRDNEPMAKKIFEDMRNEKPERMKSIRDELLNITSKDFWEVIDRGTNFDYLPDDRKATLKTFFGWFNKLSGEYPQVSTTTTTKSN
jgi:hypothetical protein